ncbi:hypothetical protein R6Q57_005563 [Mikania cordata]
MSPNPSPDDRGSSHAPNFSYLVIRYNRHKVSEIAYMYYGQRHTPLQIIHVIGNFLRIWSVYSMYRYLSQTGASVVLFIFTCVVPSSIIFLVLQKPWRGRPLSNTQVVPAVINGGITALYYILWGIGLKSCGPVRAILAEYSGAVLGVLSAALYGRRGHILKKVGGLFAMLASFYFLSQGWAMATYSPFYILLLLEFELLCIICKIFMIEGQTEQLSDMKSMVAPVFAGILSALRRVIARRISLKNQLKRRLHAITIASATCFLFPVAMWDMIVGSTKVELPFSPWAFSSTILFGIILVFYVDSIAEEKLHMVFSSPRHIMVAGGCLIVMEIFYKMDFSLPGFLICCTLLGFGIYEATSLDHGKRDNDKLQLTMDAVHRELVNLSYGDRGNPLDRPPHLNRPYENRRSLPLDEMKVDGDGLKGRIEGRWGRFEGRRGRFEGRRGRVHDGRWGRFDDEEG